MEEEDAKEEITGGRKRRPTSTGGVKRKNAEGTKEYRRQIRGRMKRRPRSAEGR